MSALGYGSRAGVVALRERDARCDAEPPRPTLTVTIRRRDGKAVELKSPTVREVKRALAAAVIAEEEGNISRAAKRLGICRQTLHDWLRE